MAQESRRPRPPLARHPGINRLLIWTPECLTSSDSGKPAPAQPSLVGKAGGAGKAGGGGGRRLWNVDGRGVAPLEAAASARPLGEAARGGSRGRGGWCRLKSRRLDEERRQCGVGAASGWLEDSEFESRLRQPEPAAASPCAALRSGVKGARSGRLVSYSSSFSSARRPQLSLWGASPQGQSLPGVCAEFGPRPPTPPPPCPSSTRAPSRASWSRWPSRSPTWSSCTRRARWTERPSRTSLPPCRPCRPLSATWCG